MITLRSPSLARPTLGQRLARLSPFGLGHTKPKHFRDMLRVV